MKGLYQAPKVMNQLQIPTKIATMNRMKKSPPHIVKSVFVVHAYRVSAKVTPAVIRAAVITSEAE